MAHTDLLERQHLIDELTRSIVKSSDASVGARTVALVGPWGSGKTWVLEQVRPALGGITREFNPWLYSDEIGLFRGFAALVIERIGDKRARKNVIRTLELIGPSVKGFGFDMSGSLSKTVDLLKGDGSPAAIRARIKSAIGPDPKPTYVIIDDLDRLTSDELLLVLKLLRLVGDLPGFVYVLAYDEATLLRLMMRTEIAFGSMELARNYLDKIVERKIVMPAITDSRRDELVLNPILEFGRATHPHFDDREAEHLAWKMQTLVYPRLTSMRLCQRYVGSVTSLATGLHGEVRYRDWVLLSYLRTAEPHAFHVIQKYPSTLLGVARGFGIDTTKSAEHAKSVAEELVAEAADASHKSDLLDFIDELFPQFASLRKGQKSYSGDSRQGIDSSIYFGLYFEHGLPNGAISDVAVESKLAALAEASTNEDDPGQLTELIRDQSQTVISAITRRWKRAVSPDILFAFLEGRWATGLFDYTVEGIFKSSGKSQVRVLAKELLPAFSKDALELLSNELTPAFSVDSLLVNTLVSFGPAAGSMYFVDWVKESREKLSRLLAERMSTAASAEERATASRALGHLDRSALLSAAKDHIRGGAVSSIEATSWFVRSTSKSGEIRNVHIADHALRDADLVAMLVSGDPGEYPKEWDNADTLHSALNSDPQPAAVSIASYILADWNSRSTALEQDDDEWDE